MIASACGSSSSDSSADSAEPATTTAAKTSATEPETRTSHDSETAPDDGSDQALHIHGQESDITYAELPADTKAEVDELMAEYADKFPTAADATNSGWMKTTPSFYGIGSHYTNVPGFPATPTFDLMNPNMLLYDGEGPDAPFAGVSYAVNSGTNPEGFAGPYDAWHSHASVCLKGGVVSLIDDDSEIWLSASECTERGGNIFPIPGDLMIHVWIGPGYFDEAPIFAHDHPKLFDGFLPQRDV